jgi:hypothetical protein
MGTHDAMLNTLMETITAAHIEATNQAFQRLLRIYEGDVAQLQAEHRRYSDQLVPCRDALQRRLLQHAIIRIENSVDVVQHEMERVQARMLQILPSFGGNHE